jgi:hypothetical protein
VEIVKKLEVKQITSAEDENFEDKYYQRFPFILNWDTAQNQQGESREET